MTSRVILTAILSGGVTGGVISAVWNHFSKLWLQRHEAGLKQKLAALDDAFQRSQRQAQAEIDRSVFVTRAHFETEFEAMKEMFSCLSQVQLAMNGLRPTFSVEPTDETDEERRKRLSIRLKNLSDVYNKLIVESEARAPFYTAELYSAVEGCLRAASTEINSVRTAGANTFTFDWFQEGEKNRGTFSQSYYKVAEIIRDRISRLAVLPTH
jgi:hypothetical protein